MQPVQARCSRACRVWCARSPPSSANRCGWSLSGEHTEVDKTVVEELADPLTHMIRNAIDHGIEAPDGPARRGQARGGARSSCRRAMSAQHPDSDRRRRRRHQPRAAAREGGRKGHRRRPDATLTDDGDRRSDLRARLVHRRGRHRRFRPRRRHGRRAAQHHQSGRAHQRAVHARQGHDASRSSFR